MHTFAVESKSLFPITDRDHTKVSAERFRLTMDRLPVAEQLSGMRKIASACDQFDIDGGAALEIRRRAGRELSEDFEAFMDVRLTEARDRVEENRIKHLKTAGLRIAEEKNDKLRWDMLDLLCEKIAAFDEEVFSPRLRAGIPNAVSTVFLIVDSEKIASLGAKPHVDVGGRKVTAEVLSKFDKVAAEKALVSNDVVAKAATLESFKGANDIEKDIILSFVR